VAESDFSYSVWTPQDVGTTVNLASIIPGWTAGAGDVVRLYSPPTWYGRDLPDAGESFSLFTNSVGACFAAGTGGSIFYTSKFGMAWTLQAVGAYALHAGDAQGYAVGDHGTILESTSGGSPWNAVASGTVANLYGVVAGGPYFAVAVGAGGTILKSADGGLTFSPRASGTTATLRAIDISRGGTSALVAVGDGGCVLKSTDQGETWCTLDAGTTANLYGVTVPSGNEYLVCGQGGVLLHTTTGGGSCLLHTDVPAVAPGAGDVRLGDLVPNPIKSSGAFDIQARRHVAVRVDLLDVRGRRVASLFDGELNAGEHRSLSVDARSLAAGIYFARAHGEGFDFTKRVIVAP